MSKNGIKTIVLFLGYALAQTTQNSPNDPKTKFRTTRSLSASLGVFTGYFYWENYIMLRYKVSQLSDTLAKFLNVKLAWNQVVYKMSLSSHILPIPYTYKKEGEKGSLLTTKSQYSMQNVNWVHISFKSRVYQTHVSFRDFSKQLSWKKHYVTFF